MDLWRTDGYGGEKVPMGHICQIKGANRVEKGYTSSLKSPPQIETSVTSGIAGGLRKAPKRGQKMLGFNGFEIRIPACQSLRGRAGRNPKFETISNDQNLNDQNILFTTMDLKNFFTCFDLLDIHISDLFRIS